MYKIKEIFYTLQGEGAQSGRPAVFLRFSGCNLWSGREEDRAAAICNFCDTDFRGTDGPLGGTYQSPEAVSQAVKSLWPGKSKIPPYVVCTGGEPLLQLDEALIQSFHAHGFLVSVETNGTMTPPRGIDWLCMSPKAGTDIRVTQGQELKLVFPQEGLDPARFESWDFNHFYLQPMDGPDRESNTQLALSYCLAHPKWKLSLQTHKILDIP